MWGTLPRAPLTQAGGFAIDNHSHSFQTPAQQFGGPAAAQAQWGPQGGPNPLSAAAGAYPQGAYPPGAYPQGAFPPGAYPQGAFPPGAYPQGAFPPGAFPPGAAPPGAFPPGAFPPGAFPQGAFPQGAFPQGAYPQGAYPQGAYPQGAYPPGAAPPGAYPPGAYPQGAFPPGAAPPGAFPPGAAPPGAGPPGATQPAEVLAAAPAESAPAAAPAAPAGKPNPFFQQATPRPNGRRFFFATRSIAWLWAPSSCRLRKANGGSALIVARMPAPIPDPPGADAFNFLNPLSGGGSAASFKVCAPLTGPLPASVRTDPRSWGHVPSTTGAAWTQSTPKPAAPAQPAAPAPSANLLSDFDSLI